MRDRYFSFESNRMTGFQLAALALLFWCCGFVPNAMAAGYEKIEDRSARTILTPDQLKGPLHQVADRVEYDGLFYRYQVTSPFGQFTAYSTFALEALIRELAAIEAMRSVNTGQTALKSMETSAHKSVTGLKNLITEPVATLGGAAESIGSLFDRASQSIGRRETTETEDSKAAEIIGFSKSKGEIATQFGVSLYSKNQVLQEELDRLGWANYLGGISVGAATSMVPGVGGIVLTTSGTARLLNDAINSTPASKLWVENKNKLLAMGVDPDTVEFFLNNRVFSPALETVLVSTLESMVNVANREIFIKMGMQANSAEMARTITEMVVLYAGYHNHIAPLKGFAPIARFAYGIGKNGDTVIVLPTDHLVWNERIAGVALDITEKSRAGGVQLWTIGTISGQAKSSLEAAGWKVNEKAGNRLVPK